MRWTGSRDSAQCAAADQAFVVRVILLVGVRKRGTVAAPVPVLAIALLCLGAPCLLGAPWTLR